MPLYDYKCQQCGQVFEVRQKFSDDPLTTHEGCGGSVERLISAPALQFKGSGWYITDYAKSGSTPNASNKSGSGSDSKPASDSKAASKESSSTPASTTSSTDTKK